MGDGLLVISDEVRVTGYMFQVQGSVSRDLGNGSRVRGFGFWVWDSGLRVYGVWFML